MLLQTLLSEFKAKIQRLNNIVPRRCAFSSAPNKIKVAMGMRRTGKTHLMYQKAQQLIEHHHLDFSRILYINFEDDRLLPLTREKLSGLVDEFYGLFPHNHEQTCFLLFDEIQNVPDWPTVIRRLHDSKQVEIFLTGSSAKLLSKEIATNLRGRSLATEVWPYSFQEYLDAQNTAFDTSLFSQKTFDYLKKYFLEYIDRGGFPEVSHYDASDQLKTLQEYIDVVIYRDIIERHQVKNPGLIKYLILFLLNNTSRPFSMNKFYNDVKSLGYKTSKESLYEYVAHIEDAYLCFQIPLYHPSIRKVHANPKKTFAIDTGLVQAVSANGNSNLGKLFETIVFIELKRLGCEVFYYLTQQRYEVDFLVLTPKREKKLIQVCWDMVHPDTLARETRALETAKQELGVTGDIVTLQSFLQHGINLNSI